MVGGGEHHVAGALCVGENHRLQHVHHLGDVGHAQAVGVFVEHVEREGGHHGVAHGILLVEVPPYGAGLLVPPCAPFVEEQSDVLFRVFLVHNGAVPLEYIFNLEAFAEGPVVLVVVELRGGAFRAVPSRYGVVVERHAVHEVANVVHQHFCPVVVVVAGARGYLVELVAVVVAAIDGVTPEEVAVVFGPHVSAASPRLVAYAEELHLPRLVAAVLPAQLGHGCVAVAGHVFHPFCQFLNGS